jgi:hypothetical protein
MVLLATKNTQSPAAENAEAVIIAAVEGGGTSFRVAICRVHHNNHNNTNTYTIPEILHRIDIDSSHDDPARTLQECVSFLEQHKPAATAGAAAVDHNGNGNGKYGGGGSSGGGYHALGLATFGPVGVDVRRTEMYGRILPTTPKESWRNVDILTPLKAACQGSGGGGAGTELVVQVETDVNAPALAEFWQETQAHAQMEANTDHDDHNRNNPTCISSLAYVTVGTGVGVGLVVNGKPVHGRMHPEGGHVPVQPLTGDTFTGYSWNSHSPFGGYHTVEGLASSVALTERLEQREREQQSQGQQQQGQQQQQQNQRLSRSILADVPDDDEIWDH